MTLEDVTSKVEAARDTNLRPPKTYWYMLSKLYGTIAKEIYDPFLGETVFKKVLLDFHLFMGTIVV